MSPVQFGLTPEQLDFQREVRELADREFAPRAAHWDQAEQYPWDNVKILLDHGLMGLTIPPEYGGRGRTLFDAILAVEQVARACGNTARIVVEANMGAVGAIMRYGTEEQKRYYLPIVAREGDKPAIAISEPEAGSAATEMRTTARLEGDSYVLNGQKRWITGAGASRIHVVFARMNDRPGAKGIGGILVEKGTPGFRIGKRWPMMGIRGMPEAEIHLENCVVPRANALVTEDGFKKLMTAYNAQRVGASTVALGIAQGAFEYAVRFANERQQFGRPISEFQGLQWLAADMAIALEAARMLIYRAAANAPDGYPSQYEASIAKTFAAEMAIVVTNNALQFLGAYGYSREAPLERMVRDARMFTIGGGTTQMQRNLIAQFIFGRRFSQGRTTDDGR